MEHRFDTSDCKKYFGVEYTELKKLEKYNDAMFKDHSLPNELYAKIATFQFALTGILKLFK